MDVGNGITRSSIQESSIKPNDDVVVDDSMKGIVHDERHNSVVVLNKDGLNRSQFSHDTLMMTKQVSIASPTKGKEIYVDEFANKFSPGKTELGWQVTSVRADSDMNGSSSVQPFNQTSIPSINHMMSATIEAGEMTTSPSPEISKLPPSSLIETINIIPLIPTKAQKMFDDH